MLVGYFAKTIPFHMKRSLDIFFERGQNSKCVWESCGRDTSWEAAVKNPLSLSEMKTTLKSSRNPNHLFILNLEHCAKFPEPVCPEMRFTSNALSCSCWLGWPQRFLQKTEEQQKCVKWLQGAKISTEPLDNQNKFH